MFGHFSTLCNKGLKKNSYCLTQKSKQLLLNVDGDITAPSIQSQDTPTKYFTASETENYGNEFLAFKNTLWRI